MQVVRASPDIDGDQGPEVHDRQAIRVDWALGLLGYEVVHHAQEARSQEETNRVVAVPPLNHRISRTSIHGVRLGQRDRYRHAVDDVQHGHGDDESTEEPVADIDVLHLALHDGAEEHKSVAHPDDSDQDIDRPFQFGVLFGRSQAEWQRDSRQHDNQLPSPEGESCQTIGY